MHKTPAEPESGQTLEQVQGAGAGSIEGRLASGSKAQAR